MSLTYAIFYVTKPAGGYIAVCDSFSGWKCDVPPGELTDTKMQVAEESLCDWVANRMRFVAYIVPAENKRVIERLVEQASVKRS